MSDAGREGELLRRAYRYGAPYRLRCALLLLCVGASAAVALFQPRFLGGTLDGIIQRDLPRTYLLLVAMMTATVLQGAVSLAETYLTARLNTDILWRVKGDLYQRLVYLTVPVYDRTRQGDLLSRMEGDAGAVGGLVLRRLQIIPDAIRAGVILALVLRMSVPLTLVQLLILPLMYLASGYFGAALRRRNALNRLLMDRYMSFVQESAAGSREIKALQLERDRIQGFGLLANQLLTSSIGLSVVGAYAGLTNMLVSGLGSVAVIGFAAWQIVSGYLTVGQLVTFTAYAGQLAGALQNLTAFRRSRQEMLASIERVFGLLDEASEPAPRAPVVSLPRIQGRVVLEGVCFGYESGPTVLKGVSCCLEPGKVTGFAGLSGSGKTTLFNLLLRFYAPQEGAIYLDGRDIRDYELPVLRRAISIVSQDPFFFRASIRENLLYAHPGATRREIERACELANATEFIERLPQGYETPLGERGSSLSGGQRQRLALARAILRGSPVLLCDEITSALDAEAEFQVQQALRALARDHTIALVAHRPSSMRHADTIVVLHGGRVVGQGTHDELLRDNAVYRRLYLAGGQRRAI
ncbi:MAG: ABC transporter ATP-binding protein/permease [Acetobacteraceae bacterium]|nr:ABC transporter ATP-binding protein/permease [Acetobacteraceae bacterium]